MGLLLKNYLKYGCIHAQFWYCSESVKFKWPVSENVAVAGETFRENFRENTGIFNSLFEV
jgi:hypothetical protein